MKKVTIIEITDIYWENAKPKDGTLSREHGFTEKSHDDEISIASVLFTNYGGDIVLLAEESFRKENPDYRWNGKLWDLKTPSKIKNLGKLVQKGLSQIFPSPGGLIIDVSGLKEPQEKIERAVEERMQTSMRHTIDVIFIRDKAVVKVLRYKK